MTVPDLHVSLDVPPAAPDLHVSLDVPLPSHVGVGRGTALFVAGTCYCPTARIEGLELVVDGERQAVMEFGMPRLDFFASLHPRLDPYAAAGLAGDPDSPDDPQLHSYRSGFWGIARVYGGADRGSGGADGGSGGANRGPVQLRVRAQLEGGGSAEAELASVAVESLEPPPEARAWPAGSPERSVAICMATFNPPPELLRRQLDSIRAQSHRNWVCLISDDCSAPDAFARIVAAVEGDPRFVVSRAPRRLGFYENFERALALAPADAQFVAMADQDDYWYPEKLESLVAEIGDAQLVYSDARVVGRDGAVISDTYWSVRRNNHSDLLSLLVANAVTGAASLMRREVLDYALPFPPAQFAHFHDHWVGLTALALGRIAFVDRPLYDYVQHGGASLGHAAANRMTGLAERLRGQRAPRERIRMWRLHYFVDVCRLMQVAAILELRGGARMSAGKRRKLRRFLRADRSSWPLLVLGARGARELTGRRETLGAEWMLFHALVWRRLLALSATDRPRRALRLDAVPPPSLALKPSRSALTGTPREIAEKVAPLELAISDQEPVRANLLIPTIDLQHFFGGYITALNLARLLAERGQRVRLVTVDPVGPLPRNWKQAIESYSGLDGVFERVEVAFGRGPSPLPVSPDDGFIATTWWTGLIAAGASRTMALPRFVYLIQEYEPFTFPMGTYAALAAQSYRTEHFALFSSELLRDYFRRHRIGVYAAGVEPGDRESLAFQNAITPVQAPTAAELAARRPRRLLFYARPEPHAARNMFELGVLALSSALEDGAFQSGWELHGIGTVRGASRISLGGGRQLELLPRADQRAYAALLREHDVGLALMYTPHPSLVPIEMACAGMLTVTNSFENKTPEAMSSISPNIITVEPTVEGVAGALKAAAGSVDEIERRVRGSDVRWATDWADAFDESLLRRVSGALASGRSG